MLLFDFSRSSSVRVRVDWMDLVIQSEETLLETLFSSDFRQLLSTFVLTVLGLSLIDGTELGIVDILKHF